MLVVIWTLFLIDSFSDMKKILVISPGPFSTTDNDGQTLEDIFCKWDKDKMAQFYTQDIRPDFNFCSRYYRLSDRGVLKKLLRMPYNPYPSIEQIGNTNLKTRGLRKTPLSMIARNWLWSLSPWCDKSFNEWIESFSPDVIFFEIGDNAYMMNFVIKLKRKLGIPLIIHNTEGFYFFKHNYCKQSNRFESLFYPMIHRSIVRSYNNIMGVTSYALYSCDKIKNQFDKLFSVPSTTILKSGVIPTNLSVSGGETVKIISYVGNLGFHRVDALIDIADALKDYGNPIKIDVYGKCKTDEDEHKLMGHERIHYHGFIDYPRAQEVIKNSDILLHVESELSGDDVAYGFSTKIPECLSSGKVFFMYSPIYVAGAQYLHSFIPETVAITKSQLHEKLYEIIHDKFLRKEIINRELSLAQTNHNASVISKKFESIIENIDNHH